MSTLDPMSTVATRQYYTSEREMQAVFMKVVTKKNEKEKRYLIDVQFSTDKKLATGQDRQRKAVLDPTFGCFY